jgi:hypothetical protein
MQVYCDAGDGSDGVEPGVEVVPASEVAGRYDGEFIGRTEKRKERSLASLEMTSSKDKTKRAA